MHDKVKQCESTMSPIALSRFFCREKCSGGACPRQVPMGIVDEEKKSLWLLSICGLSVCRK
jgi:hypothetical protein